MSLNAMGMMSAAEVRLAALDEGTQLGLFGAAIPDWPLNSSDPEMVQLRVDRREVLWKLALAKLHDTVPLPFNHLDDPTIDPFADD